MNREKAVSLGEQGRALLDQEEYAQAEEFFIQALAESDDPIVRNNLAMTRFLLGRPEDALETLDDDLDDLPNPFRKSLKAQCLAALGRMDGARRMVREAVRDFEGGTRAMKIGRVSIHQSWREYTVMVMRAAAETRDHRQVLELYKRWQSYHVRWENKYLAGVAAFNLQRFRQSASYWTGLGELPYALQLQLVCMLADKGVVPPFLLEYDVISQKSFEKYRVLSEEEMEKMLAESGTLRMLFLMSILDEDKDDKTNGMDALVIHGGDWGQRLGLEFLDAAMISENIKFAAAQALVKAGVFAEGEEVPILVDGERRFIKVSQIQVSWEPDEKVIKHYNRALSLRDKGKIEEAMELLSELNAGSVFFPPALLVLANIYRTQEMPEKARPLLKILGDVAPEHPIILYNLAGFFLEAGDREQAKTYFDRIDPKQENLEFQEKLKWMKQAIELSGREVSFFVEAKRIEIEEKKLPTEPTVARGLRNMPVQWVREACAFWNVGCDYRKDGEVGLVEALASASRIRKAVLRLPIDEQELLKYLLEKGGFTRVSAITRKFGSMEGDGFLGGKEPPRSALGRLWLKAFVFVGRSLLNGRNEKIVAVPVDIREELKKVLAVSKD